MHQNDMLVKAHRTELLRLTKEKDAFISSYRVELEQLKTSKEALQVQNCRLESQMSLGMSAANASLMSQVADAWDPVTDSNWESEPSKDLLSMHKPVVSKASEWENVFTG